MVRIYIVDDNEQFAKYMSRYLLSQENLSVAGFSTSGQAAIEALGEIDCDVVLMDIAMPNMNGLDTTKKLRENGFDKGIIVVSMHDDRYYNQTVQEAGADAYINKSDFCDKVIPTIERVLDSKRQISNEAR
ncbi:response regulator transcription factor [bacterium]|nr:response regulator transcription factor [bacterium]